MNRHKAKNIEMIRENRKKKEEARRVRNRAPFITALNTIASH